MRTILVLAVLLAAAFGLVTSRGAEPVEPPAAATVSQKPESNSRSPAQATPPAELPTTPPVAVSAAQPPVVWSAPPAYGPGSSGSWEDPGRIQDELQRLRPYFINLAEQRAERMTVAELKQGIAEMRRQCLIAELTEFARGSEDNFDSMRAEISVMVLTAKDRNELASAIRTVAKELDKATPKSE